MSRALERLPALWSTVLVRGEPRSAATAISPRWTSASHQIGITFNTWGGVTRRPWQRMDVADSRWLTNIKTHIFVCLHSGLCSDLFEWYVFCFSRTPPFAEPSATRQLPVPAKPGLLQNQGSWSDEQDPVRSKKWQPRMILWVSGLTSKTHTSIKAPLADTQDEPATALKPFTGCSSSRRRPGSRGCWLQTLSHF